MMGEARYFPKRDPSSSHDDLFFRALYLYHTNRGFWSTIAHSFSSFLSTLFFTAIVTFLSTCLDYGRILHCAYDPEPDCTKLIRFHIIPGLFPFLIVIEMVQLVVLIYKILALVDDCIKYSVIRRHYRKMGLCDADLQAMSFEAVVVHIVAYCKQLDLKRWGNLTQFDVITSITRLNNLLTKLYSADSISDNEETRNTPSQSYLISTKAGLIRQRPNSTVYLDMLLRRFVFPVILPAMETILRLRRETEEDSIQILAARHNDTLRYDLKQGIKHKESEIKSQQDIAVSKLQKRFVLIGLLTLIAFPFVFLYFVISFAFVEGKALTEDFASILSYSFTRTARWRFRLYNELDQPLNKRLDDAAKVTAEYLDSTESSSLQSLAGAVTVGLGGLALICLLLSMLGERLLLRVSIAGRTLLFYSSIITTVYLAVKKFGEQKKGSKSANELMREILRTTLFMPSAYAECYGVDTVALMNSISKEWRGRRFSIKQLHAPEARQPNFPVSLKQSVTEQPLNQIPSIPEINNADEEMSIVFPTALEFSTAFDEDSTTMLPRAAPLGLSQAINAPLYSSGSLSTSLLEDDSRNRWEGVGSSAQNLFSVRHPPLDEGVPLPLAKTNPSTVRKDIASLFPSTIISLLTHFCSAFTVPLTFLRWGCGGTEPFAKTIFEFFLYRCDVLDGKRGVSLREALFPIVTEETVEREARKKVAQQPNGNLKFHEAKEQVQASLLPQIQVTWKELASAQNFETRFDTTLDPPKGSKLLERIGEQMSAKWSSTTQTAKLTDTLSGTDINLLRQLQNDGWTDIIRKDDDGTMIPQVAQPVAEPLHVFSPPLREEEGPEHSGYLFGAWAPQPDSV
ncbi:putative autophagy protein Apg9 [Blattamonas nauphoetae]|uniref:Autophagy-related protein 9 n=1 Tax=Blattamonas nauphoetae TaxID=2049346 RepID=A0ABQ9YBW2_9EUKA|nr:putative autophagy protein Apg9 [Blattamonas nauphoetae]